MNTAEPIDKKCTKCGEIKPIDQFRLKKDRGHIYRWYLCIECQNKRDRLYRVKNRFALEEARRLKDRLKPLKAKKLKQKKTIQEIRKAERDRYYLNRENNLKNRKDYYQSHKIERLEYGRLYRNKNKYYAQLSRRSRRIKDPTAKTRANIIGRMTISNQYIKKLINQSTGLSYKNIPPDLIESWRMQIKVKRLIKQKKDENITTS